MSSTSLSHSVPIVKRRSQTERLRQLCAQFQRIYPNSDGEIVVVEAPLRLCPIGAHSDHQNGKVSGFCIDRSVMLAVARRKDARFSIRSSSFEGDVDFLLSKVPAAVPGEWGNYARGAVLGLQSFLHNREEPGLRFGMNALLDAEMPIGGLSSSAAVTVAYLIALEQINQISLPAMDNVHLVRYAENLYIGLQNGIMDQAIIIGGKKDHLTLIDCLDEKVSAIACAAKTPEVEFLVVYSGLSRQLMGTLFNQRVSECVQAAEFLLDKMGQASCAKPRLRNIPRTVFEECAAGMPANLRLRATHFFTEFERVERGAAFWEKADFDSFGKLITASGESSIKNFESGSAELISLYEILAQTSGVLGTRFCGGGFKGCCLAMIRPGTFESIASEVFKKYREKHAEAASHASFHLCQTAAAARLLTNREAA